MKSSASTVFQYFVTRCGTVFKERCVDLFPLSFMLEIRLSRCEHAFKNALMINAGAHRHNRRHQLEGALSDAWQAYCSFVRQLLIRSCGGCTTAGGVMHAASIKPSGWKRASYIAIQASREKAVQVGRVNDILRREPTWGDASNIAKIVSSLNPGNSQTLISHLCGGLLGPKHCQVVRNACAHRNHQTKREVESLAAGYLAFRIKDPIDAMTWRESTTLDYAFLSWLDDMRTIAAGAVG